MAGPDLELNAFKEQLHSVPSNFDELKKEGASLKPQRLIAFRRGNDPYAQT
jgi:hypothetical protein